MFVYLSLSLSLSLSLFPLHMSHYCKRERKGTCEVLGTPDPAKTCSTKHIHSLQSGLRRQVIEYGNNKNLQHLSHVIMQLEMYI